MRKKYVVPEYEEECLTLNEVLCASNDHSTTVGKSNKTVDIGEGIVDLL